MRRALGRDDFRRADELVGKPKNEPPPGDVVFPDGDCWVCDEYEMRGEHIVAASDKDEVKRWHLFRPLEDAPDLFLRFGRLCKEPDFASAALSFARRYGLPRDDEDDASSTKRPEKLHLASFLRESRQAWAVVALYECVLTENEVAATEILADHKDDGEYFRLAFYDPDSGSPSDTPLLRALTAAAAITEETATRLTRQWMYIEVAGRTRPDPSWIKLSWVFDNLLGAMYLQMRQLLVAGGGVARCGHCQRIISLGPPLPGGRKRRNDKRFCDDACRQAHHRSKKKT
jgi:hypothetical protein